MTPIIIDKAYRHTQTKLRIKVKSIQPQHVEVQQDGYTGTFLVPKLTFRKHFKLID